MNEQQNETKEHEQSHETQTPTEREIKLKNYKIYQNYDGKIQFVKEGFCWPAFFFTGIWALVKKLWIIAAILIGITLVLNGVFYLINHSGLMIECSKKYYGSYDYNSWKFTCEYNETKFFFLSFAVFVISLAYRFVIGKFANLWREQDLLKRGYEQVDVITAQTLEMAQGLYKKKLDERKSE